MVSCRGSRAPPASRSLHPGVLISTLLSLLSRPAAAGGLAPAVAQSQFPAITSMESDLYLENKTTKDNAPEG